jgi:short-subunit dehydrogenase
MLYLKNKKALVTGASSGIGSITAKLLAQQGALVILTARNVEKLSAIEREITEAGGEAFSIPADLSREAERVRVIEIIHSRFGAIDILINNAGFGWYGYGSDMSWEIADEMIRLNIGAVVHFSLLVLKEMQARNDGHIVNVSSIAANLPTQGIALYSGTKAFIDNFTISLFRELRGSRVKISVIKPGPVKTNFFTYARDKLKGLVIPAARFGISPLAVAKKIVALVLRPRKIAYIPRFFSLVPFVEFIFSRFIDLLGPLLLKKRTL